MKAKKKGELRIEGKLPLRTMGISNRSYDRENKKTYSIQFYDFDGIFGIRDYNLIISIFPYDLLVYKTKHGYHFISFALLHGLNITKARAIALSKFIEDQDYWTEAKDLTLRISPKWKCRRLRKRKVISCKPTFFTLIKKPEGYIISNKHLEFYFKYMNLPKEIYQQYDDCDKRDYEIRIYHYKTRD